MGQKLKALLKFFLSFQKLKSKNSKQGKHNNININQAQTFSPSTFKQRKQMLSTSDKTEPMLTSDNKTKPNESNDTYYEPEVLVRAQVAGQKEPLTESNESVFATPKKTKSPWKILSMGSVSSRYSIFAVGGMLSIMSILSFTSFCSFLSVNIAFSITSITSVASILSYNSVLSIASMNCYGCIFNVPIISGETRKTNTCDKYKLEFPENAKPTSQSKESLFGRYHQIFTSSVKDASEEDLINDCCLFIHSAAAKKKAQDAFILNSNHTACLVFGNLNTHGNRDSEYVHKNVDMADYVYKRSN